MEVQSLQDLEPTSPGDTSELSMTSVPNVSSMTSMSSMIRPTRRLTSSSVITNGVAGVLSLILPQSAIRLEPVITEKEGCKTFSMPHWQSVTSE